MNRRAFLKGLTATAAGLLIPGQVLAEPERRIWALDSTMVQPYAWLDDYPDDEIHLALYSNTITVGDYQADYRITVEDVHNDVWRLSVNRDWVSICYDDAI